MIGTFLVSQFVNSDTGTTGLTATHFSIATNATNATNAPTRRPITVLDPHGRAWPPRLRATTRRVSVEIKVNMPHKSTLVTSCLIVVIFTDGGGQRRVSRRIIVTGTRKMNKCKNSPLYQCTH